ncbi:hypothetical protein B9Z55_002566 [Caenorhabditis nigoni]|uniref:Tyrosine-protein phosphatase domain-containing protein n=1 Tax=Caenorhabditis nigoni TaxID=1611254 RepID=A0A2G5VL40_9PELO|nr:hypothetical protein B9Z55_002566 [Caenorhabditis nigoni]
MGSKSSKVSEKPKGNIVQKLELEEVEKWETTEDEERPKDSETEDCAENDSIDNPEAVENESRNSEELESRVTTGTDSDTSGTEVDQSESDSDRVTTTETEDDDDESPEEYNSRSSSDQNEEEHDELVSALEDYVAENGISQETTETNSESQDRERIATGADVAVYQYEQDLADFVDENPSLVEESSDDEIQLLDSSSYPVQSEKRQNGMILIEVAGPRADQIQQFWQMVVEKRIPTIHMTCDYVEEGVLKCAPYNPILGETEVKCGIFVIKRLGTEAQLSVNLKRQQLLIYETMKGILEYKHSVTHFHEIENADPIQQSRNLDVINKHVSHQVKLFHEM